MAAPHVPVLPDAVRRYSAAAPGELWVDCTLGFGGHAEGLLEAGARVIGVDQDPQAATSASDRLARFGTRFAHVRGNFRDVRALLASVGVTEVDGLLADLGVSSWQLDRPERGFSFSAAGPVDMRMDPDADRSAETLIRELSVEELARIVRDYGEEPFARPIARAMRAWAEGEGPHDTVTLAAAVVRALPRKVAATSRIHPATRTFQALRMAVNDELGALEALLAAAPDLLRPGGRIVVISFHSLEDRIVKRTFAGWAGRRPPPPRRGLPPAETVVASFEVLTPRPVTADEAEVGANPRARSAKLRAARKLGEAA
jgi:16S rRNA (cytosine1402-N4)-methyltransferase